MHSIILKECNLEHDIYVFKIFFGELNIKLILKLQFKKYERVTIYKYTYLIIDKFIFHRVIYIDLLKYNILKKLSNIVNLGILKYNRLYFT